MKVVLLAGGYGTRISEETDLKPKPMVEIGGKPILWHIMKIYSHYGFNDFVILLGYKGYYIKEYFANYFLHQSDVTINMQTNKMEVHNNTSEPWKVTLVDTGLDTMTGGRIKRAQQYIGNESFLLTYGDGVSDINIADSVRFHKEHQKVVTMTAIQPEARFGNLDIDDNQNIKKFIEKPKTEAGWINGGFFICEPEVFDYISEDESCVFEQKPLQNLALDGKMVAYKHHGFWQPMDTLRDNQKLNQLWKEKIAPWKVW
ncbi:glucose-1-phosphate cytidylyltransferase [Sulfurimonas autotrophica]|uniref:Glucose-1-phosphate cytidylyltransferase n=1 Tax=Sulfurimonas autotrophica (strain ATCC BAA-671 / DSM 16294 / JCM 11897 / OK10) TaxID=563040 RepID=E0UUP8_SULAO|nr:glucose-1-phosphate cytidylyltransferase [Sulfurimonas autotrophica]ADN09552.1 glucose-1-phosphate cytidylyltransferase [Sulfurimonas autotrophica DSM 16294]